MTRQDTNELALGSSDNLVNVKITYGDDAAVVEIIDQVDGELLSHGESFRRKGDPRSVRLGVGLAAGRAFQAFADEYLGTVREELKDPDFTW